MPNVEWQLKYLQKAEADIRTEKIKNDYLKSHG